MYTVGILKHVARESPGLMVRIFTCTNSSKVNVHVGIPEHLARYPPGLQVRTFTCTNLFM